MNESELEVVRAALSEEYEVEVELGRGGMAAVYRARERRLERQVAIKVLPLSRSADRSFVERFQREARTAALLEHPHIIPIHRVGHTGRVIYFAMKYVNGPSLADTLRERTLPPAEIRRLLTEVGSALGYAAGRGVVHRDIKPANILVDGGSGRYLVSDFGIARSADAATITEAGTSVGTPRYMSPEQAGGRPLDGRSDIYSLGVVAYECLTGRPPFDEGDAMAILYAHVHNPLPRPRLDTEEERALFAIVERMLAKDAAGRFQSGDELARSLAAPPGRGSAGAAPTVRVASVPAAGGKRGMRWITATRRRTVGTIAAAVLALWGGKTALHFATKHRTRCPTEAVTGAVAVTLDAVGSLRVGRNLDVYYDVCGLERGTPFTARLQLTGQAGGVRGLFGGRSSPVTVSFDERARGPATRRHRTIELPDLSAGSYTLEVRITMADGRLTTRSHDFQMVDR